MKATTKLWNKLFPPLPPKRNWDEEWEAKCKEDAEILEEMRHARISSPRAVGALRRGVDYGEHNPEIEDAVEDILRRKGVIHGYQG